MEHIDIFRQIIERGFNAGDLTVADELCSPALIEHQYPVRTDLEGADILRAQIAAARAELPGLTLAIEDHVTSGDKLWVRLSGTGTEPRSGKRVSVAVIDVCRFEDGKLVEHWGIPDRFAIMHQSGALPPRA